MYKLNHFVVKHRVISPLIFMLPALVVEMLCFGLPPEIFTIVICVLFVYIIVITLWISKCFSKILNGAIKRMYDECDPYPMLDETEKLLTYKFKRVQNQILVIDKCAALRNIGEYEKALNILENINIDKYPVMPYVKIVYYNNLMDLYTILGEYEKADIWHNKTMQIYSDMKSNRQKKKLESTIDIATAAKHYRHDEYDEAVKILENIKYNNLCHEIDGKMLSAKIYLKTGETEKAKAALIFIKEKGNRLYAVTAAEKMLAEI